MKEMGRVTTMKPGICSVVLTQQSTKPLQLSTICIGRPCAWTGPGLRQVDCGVLSSQTGAGPTKQSLGETPSGILQYEQNYQHEVVYQQPS